MSKKIFALERFTGAIMIFKSEIVFAKIILPLIFGIILGYYSQTLQLLRIATFTLIACFVLAVAINIIYKTFKLWNYKKTIASFYYLFFFVLGIFVSIFNTGFLRSDYFGHQPYQYLKIGIDSEPQQTNDILRFEAKVTTGYSNEQANFASGKLLVALKLDTLSPVQLQYGDELLITANYVPVEPPYNPSEFNFKAWLASNNIYHQSFIRQEQLVKLNDKAGNPLVKYALAVRKKQVETLRKLIKNDEAFAVASTLILGYRANLSKETLAAYSKTGTIHALSVSGMHVGIIYLMLHWILLFLDRKHWGRIFKAVLICLLIWAYSLLTGFSPSVLRSAVMLCVFVLAKLYKRSNNSYNLLAFTAFVLLIYEPFLIWDVGFQLSFLAVFGLIYFQPKIYKWLYVENKWLDKLWSTVAISLAAQLATLPLSIYYFHQFPMYFIVSNLFIFIPITGLMYTGIAILVLQLHFLAPAFEWLIVATNSGLNWIANLPYAVITDVWLNKWQLLLLSLVIVALTIGVNYYRKAHLFMGIVLLLILQITFGYQKIKALKQQEMVFFSLRKNYAVAFINGNESILLTDLKANDKNYEFFVRPTLDQKQIKNISWINWDHDLKTANFIKRDHQIIYKGKKILLMDETFNGKKLNENPSFDFIWLHNSPKQQLEELAKTLNFSTLVIDASNKDYVISKFETQASSLKLESYTLKKQPSLTIKLN